MIFTPTVRVAEEMAAAFLADGIPAASIHGEMPVAERRALLARYHRGDVHVIANCAVLTEGFDAPAVDCIIIARPTRSRTLYVQMIGRGTRTFPGKADCLATGTGRFVLALGTGSLLLEPADGRWRVVVRDRAGIRELATALPLDYAQGTAEDYARQVGAAILVDPQAAWRSAPATDRQLSALRRCRIRPRHGLTKGEASDLLAATLADAPR